MRRALASGIAAAFGGGLALLVAVFAADADAVAPPLGPAVLGFSITLLSFLQPVAFTLNWWVTLGALGLAFRLHHQRSGPPST